MVAWGMPLTVARVYAYLLLQPGPVSADQIAGDLVISKGGAWNAARHLEQSGLIERFGEAGSKRALYAVAEDFTRSPRDYSRLLRNLGELMDEGAALAADNAAGPRLLDRSKFFLAVHQAMDAAIDDLATPRQTARRA